MPRTNMGTVPKEFEKFYRLIKSYADAPTLAAALNCAESTARLRMKDPGNLTLKELKKLNQRLHIPVEELRAAITW